MYVEVIHSSDEEKETDSKLNEDELRELLNMNSNKCIEHMRILPRRLHNLTSPYAEWYKCHQTDLHLFMILSNWKPNLHMAIG